MSFLTVSIQGKDTIRISECPPTILELLQQTIRSTWPSGVASETTLEGATLITLDGSPFIVHKSNEVRWLFANIITALQENWWELSNSGKFDSMARDSLVFIPIDRRYRSMVACILLNEMESVTLINFPLDLLNSISRALKKEYKISTSTNDGAWEFKVDKHLWEFRKKSKIMLSMLSFMFSYLAENGWRYRVAMQINPRNRSDSMYFQYYSKLDQSIPYQQTLPSSLDAFIDTREHRNSSPLGVAPSHPGVSQTIANHSPPSYTFNNISKKDKTKADIAYISFSDPTKFKLAHFSKETTGFLETAMSAFEDIIDQGHSHSKSSEGFIGSYHLKDEAFLPESLRLTLYVISTLKTLKRCGYELYANIKTGFEQSQNIDTLFFQQCPPNLNVHLLAIKTLDKNKIIFVSISENLAAELVQFIYENWALGVKEFQYLHSNLTVTLQGNPWGTTDVSIAASFTSLLGALLVYLKEKGWQMVASLDLTRLQNDYRRETLILQYESFEWQKLF